MQFWPSANRLLATWWMLARLLSFGISVESSNSTDRMNFALPYPVVEYVQDQYSFGNPNAAQLHVRDAGNLRALPVNGTPIKVFASVPLSFNPASDVDYSGFAPPIFRAFDLFTSWVNEVHNGVLLNGTRHSFHFTIVDDRSNETAIQEAYQDHLNNGTRIFLAPYGPLTEAAAKVVENENAVMVAASAARTDAFVNRSNVFSVVPPPVRWFEAAIRALAHQGASTAVAVAQIGFPPEACGSLMPSLALWNMSMHPTIIFADSHNISSAIDALEQIAQVSQPDVLFACSYDDFCIELLQEMGWHADLNFKAIVVSICATAPNFLKQLGDLGRYVVGVTPWESQSITKSDATGISSKDFNKIYEHIYSSLAVPASALAFAACETLLIGLESANSTDPAAIVSALKSIRFKSIGGTVAFDNNGMSSLPFVAVQHVEHKLAGKDPLVVMTLHSNASVSAGMVYPMPPFDLRTCFHPNLDRLLNIGLEGLVGNRTCATCSPGQITHWEQEAWYGHPGWQCSTVITCTPGQLEILDDCFDCPAGKYGSQSFTCEFCPIGKFSDQPLSTICMDCPAGKHSAILGAEGCQECQHGTEATHSGTRVCRDCLPGSNRSGTETSTCELCPEGYTANMAAAANCTECPPGRYSLWGNQQCGACSRGRFQAASGRGTCLECPHGATCSENGTAHPSNMRDYWHFVDPEISDASLQQKFVSCMHEEFCNVDGTCREGHTGIVCGICVPGYSFSLFSFQCHKCPNKAVNVLCTSVLLIILCGVSFVMANWAIQGAYQTKAMTSALLKLLFNYVTTMSFMAIVLFRELQQKDIYRKEEEDGGQMGKTRSGMAHWFNSNFLSMQTSFFSLECLIEPGMSSFDRKEIAKLVGLAHVDFLSDQYREAREALASFHRSQELRRIVLWAVIPIILGLLLHFIGILFISVHLRRRRTYYSKAKDFFQEIADFGWVYAIKRRSHKEYQAYMDSYGYRLFGIWRIITLASCSGSHFRAQFRKMGEPLWVVIVFVTFPYIMRAFLRPLTCVQPGSGYFGYRVEAAMDLECYDGDRLFWISTTLIVAMGIGVPGLGCFGLWEHRDKLGKDRYKRTYGFLITGYEVDCRGWECFVLFRKTIAASVALLGMEQGVRIGAMIFVAMFFFIMHVFYKPFDNRFSELLDCIEWRHLLCWVLWSFVLLAMHMIDDEAPIEVYTVFLIVLGAMHVWFVLMVVKHIFRHAALLRAETVLERAWREQSQQLLQDAFPDGSSDRILQVTHEMKRLPEDVKEHKLPVIEKCVMRYYVLHMNTLPYLTFHDTTGWTQLMGNSGSSCLPPENHSRESRELLDPVELPGNVKSVSERQGKALLSIISEAFEYAIVNQELNAFSTSFLEFVIRAGCAWGSDSQRRTVTISHVAFHTMAKRTSKRQSRRKDNSGVSSGVTAFGHALSHAATYAASKRSSKHSGNSGDASVVASSSVTSDRHENDIMDSDLAHLGRSIELSLKDQRSFQVKRAEKKFKRQSSKNSLDSGTSEASLSSNTESVPFYIPDHADISESREMRHVLQEAVRWMFDQHVFLRGITFQELHLNLAATMLTKSNHDLAEWFDIFEHHWVRMALEETEHAASAHPHDYAADETIEDVTRSTICHPEHKKVAFDVMVQAFPSRIDDSLGPEPWIPRQRYILHNQRPPGLGTEAVILNLITARNKKEVDVGFNMLSDEMGMSGVAASQILMSVPDSSTNGGPRLAFHDMKIAADWNRLIVALLTKYYKRCCQQPFMKHLRNVREKDLAKKDEEQVLLEFELRQLLDDVERERTNQNIENNSAVQQREGIRLAMEAAKKEQARLCEEMLMLRNELAQLEAQVSHNEKKKLEKKSTHCFPSPRILAQSDQENDPPVHPKSPSPPDTGRVSNPSTESTAVPDTGRVSVDDAEEFVPLDPQLSSIGQVQKGKKDRMCSVGGLFQSFGR